MGRLGRLELLDPVLDGGGQGLVGTQLQVEAQEAPALELAQLQGLERLDRGGRGRGGRACARDMVAIAEEEGGGRLNDDEDAPGPKVVLAVAEAEVGAIQLGCGQVAAAAAVDAEGDSKPRSAGGTMVPSSCIR